MKKVGKIVEKKFGKICEKKLGKNLEKKFRKKNNFLASTSVGDPFPGSIFGVKSHFLGQLTEIRKNNFLACTRVGDPF